MVGFGQQIASKSVEEWRENYLDYGGLKRSIKACAQAEQGVAAAAMAAGEAGGQHSPERSAVAARLLDAHKAIFQGRLDAEVLKVLGFYKQRSQELLQAVQHAVADVQAVMESLEEEEQQQPPASISEAAEQVAMLDGKAAEVRRLIQQTTALLQYVGLNMTAIRKILKKFAKNVEATNAPILGRMALEVEHPDDPGWRVLQGTFLPAAVAEELQGMQQHGELQAAMAQLQALYGAAQDCRRRMAASSVARDPSQGERQLASIADHMEEMWEAEEEAVRHAAFVHAVPWMERAAGMFEPPPPDRFAVATLAGLALNNLSTLLFMANYTAVLPPTNALCVRIGVPSSYTGFIMAASDLAALFASVGISFWTQRSYREPLLFSAAACLAGNLLFVLSYAWRSLPALLLARMLNGLGSARTANRRYTADYVSRAKRTLASAAFVGASNLGMALGPLLSLPLAYLPEGRQLAGLPVNSITAVGWIMAFAWLAFLLATMAWFPEPPRRLPIGLARLGMLLPTEGGTAGRAVGASRQASPVCIRSDGQLTQPLLMAAGPSGAQADVEGQVVAEGGQQQSGQAAVQHEKGRGGPEAAAPAAVWRATIPGTVASTLALFVQKMVQQSYMDALPVFTQVMYSWRSAQKGLFLGLVSLAMVPVNAAVGALSAHVSDRSMVFGSLAMCTACLLALTASTASAAVFFGGGVMLFVGSVVLEGTATSLMSKCIWRGFAQGVLNAGLLSTEAGTLGRFAGNALLAGTGKLTGLQDVAQLTQFARLLFTTLAAVCAALLVLLGCTYSRLRG